MKRIVFCRGLSGSGKTRLAQTMQKEEGAVVFNNDELLTFDGVYQWDEDHALTAHWANQCFVLEAMRNEIPLLVVDNTNILPYHATPYVRLAKHYNYEFVVIEMTTEWAMDVKELEKRNAHGVPLSVLEEMHRQFVEVPKDAFIAILNAEFPMDPENSLRMAQMYIEKNRLICADECMLDYEDWLRIGGYEPEEGSDTAMSINEKLQDWRDSKGLFS